MPILDRYMLRQFLQVFVICFISLTGLYIVIDAFSNLDEFINAGKQGGLLKVMGNYYAYRAISFFEQTSSVLTLISAMFTVTWIQRHNELTAIEAAGIPKSRVVVPVIVAVAVISVVSAVSREAVIPRIRTQLALKAQDLDGSSGQRLARRYDLETGILLGGAESFADKQRIAAPDFLLPTGLGKHGKHLTAAEALYRPAEANHPGGYLFRKVQQPKYITGEPSLKLEGKAVIITPREAPWLAADEVFVVSQVSFEQLSGGTEWRNYSSTLELIRGLSNPSLENGADVRVAIHARFVQPILDMTLLFLGLPLVLTKENRNMFMAIGMCVLVVAMFMFVCWACQVAGAKYFDFVSPALAAWLPLIIFVPWAVGLSEPLRQ